MAETKTKTKGETDCINCCFADVRDGEQWDCELGRLAKYKSQDAKIVLDDGYYRILDRKCNAFRPKAWREHRENKSVDELAAEVYGENRQTFSVVIVADQNHTLDDVKKSLASVSRGVGKVVVSIVNNDDLYRSVLIYLCDEWSGCPWDIVLVQPLEERLRDDFGNSTFQMAVHDGVANVVSDWYSAAYAGYQWNTDDFTKLDKFMNVDIGRVGVIGPDRKGNGFIAFTKYHNHPRIGGMFEKPIYKKAQQMSKDADENMPFIYMTRNQFKELKVG